MASESGFNPVPVLVHLVAIAVGLYLGFLAMDAITPDLPGESVEPGVSSSSVPCRTAHHTIKQAATMGSFRKTKR